MAVFGKYILACLIGADYTRPLGTVRLNRLAQDRRPGTDKLIFE
jgi:hypothetical protein